MAKYVIVSGPGAKVGEGRFWQSGYRGWSDHLSNAKRFASPDEATVEIARFVSFENKPRIRRLANACNFSVTSIEDAVKSGGKFALQYVWWHNDVCDDDTFFLTRTGCGTTSIKDDGVAIYDSLHEAAEDQARRAFIDGTLSASKQLPLRKWTIVGVKDNGVQLEELV